MGTIRDKCLGEETSPVAAIRRRIGGARHRRLAIPQPGWSSSEPRCLQEMLSSQRTQDRKRTSLASHYRRHREIDQVECSHRAPPECIISSEAYDTGSKVDDPIGLLTPC